MRRIALRFAAMAPVLAALTACGGGGTLTSTSSSDSASSTADTTQAKTALETALETCNIFGEPWATLGDNNKTLTIDGAGKDDNSTDADGNQAFNAAPIEKQACVLQAVQAPQSVISQMSQTRALDGMQDATWGQFSAKWTYHPDNGLDIIVTER
jgi:hypothetical protein